MGILVFLPSNDQLSATAREHGSLNSVAEENSALASRDAIARSCAKPIAAPHLARCYWDGKAAQETVLAS